MKKLTKEKNIKMSEEMFNALESLPKPCKFAREAIAEKLGTRVYEIKDIAKLGAVFKDDRMNVDITKLIINTFSTELLHIYSDTNTISLLHDKNGINYKILFSYEYKNKSYSLKFVTDQYYIDSIHESYANFEITFNEKKIIGLIENNLNSE